MKTTNSLQATLWSKRVSKLNTEKDKIYIVHQILAFGSIEQLAKLFKKFPKNEIIHVFTKYPQKIYNRAQLNFVKNILRVKNLKVNEKKYLKNPS